MSLIGTPQPAEDNRSDAYSVLGVARIDADRRARLIAVLPGGLAIEIRQGETTHSAAIDSDRLATLLAETAPRADETMEPTESTEV